MAKVLYEVEAWYRYFYQEDGPDIRYELGVFENVQDAKRVANIWDTCLCEYYKIPDNVYEDGPGKAVIREIVVNKQMYKLDNTDRELYEFHFDNDLIKVHVVNRELKRSVLIGKNEKIINAVQYAGFLPPYKFPSKYKEYDGAASLDENYSGFFQINGEFISNDDYINKTISDYLYASSKELNICFVNKAGSLTGYWRKNPVYSMVGKWTDECEFFQPNYIDDSIVEIRR